MGTQMSPASSRSLVPTGSVVRVGPRLRATDVRASMLGRCPYGCRVLDGPCYGASPAQLRRTFLEVLVL